MGLAPRKILIIGLLEIECESDFSRQGRQQGRATGAFCPGPHLVGAPQARAPTAQLLAILYKRSKYSNRTVTLIQ